MSESKNESTDLDVQLESPQRTIRAEATQQGEREGRPLTHGETRVYLHAVNKVNRLLQQAAQRVTLCRALLAAARADAEAWLAELGDRETGDWMRDKDAHRAHHERGASGEDCDVALLSRRPWLPDGMYDALLAVLFVADFLFFLTLWRDIEEADGWLSVATLQAALYGLITPVAAVVVMRLLGRTVASRIRRGSSVSSADRGRLWATVVVGAVSVLVILAAVKQRLTSLYSVEGGVDLFEPLFFLLFLLLPLALGVAEIFRHDEDVELDRLRTENRDGADAHVATVYDEGKRLWKAWNDAHLQGVQLVRTLDIELQEPLHAAADLISQERAHNGSDGDLATLLWPVAQASQEGDVDVALPADSLDPVLAGPVPRVKAELLADLRAGLETDRPEQIDAWLKRIKTILNAGAVPKAVDADEKPADSIGGLDRELADLAALPGPRSSVGGEA